MKKITLILCLFITSFGLSQTLLEDFEGPTYPALASGNGAPLPTVVADPAGVNGDVLRVITNAAAAPWQQAELTLQGPFLDLSGTDKRVSVDWYSVAPFDALLRVEIGGPASAAQAVHTGGGWQTLVFDFNLAEDNTTIANGIYQRMFFFNLWDVDVPRGGVLGGDGWFIGNGSTTGSIASTTYVDNITEGVFSGTTWTGNGDTDTNWNTAANWSAGVPTAIISANIPNLTNDPIAAGGIAVSGMTIQSGASLTVNGAVTNTGIITVSSGASFIAKTSVSGIVTYERDLNSSNWYSIASPVVGQDVDDFVAASGLQSGGGDVSLCTFDTAINDWVFYQSGTSNADVLNEGQGYIVNLTAAAGEVSFSGTMNVGNETMALATTGEGYNLLGNPYPSYIDSSAMLTGSSGSLLSQTIWVWDQSTNAYEVKVTADNFQIAPGQGFFVQSNGAAGNVAINEAFQNHQATDSFLRSANRTEVYLALSNGTNTTRCKLYYIDGTSTGFDNGFDGPTFRAFPEPLSIYTHLITNNFGMDLSLQSLPNDDYENLVIPVGIDAVSGTEITISASSLNLPTGIDIYLEDRTLNTFTLLSANSDYTLTPATDLNGTGRFYLRTTSDTLGLNENTLVAYDLQIYTADALKQIIIKGQLSSNITNADLYDLQGKLVLSKTLDLSKSTNTLDTSSLSSGLYVVKVEGGNQSKTQKVLIK